MSMNDVRQNSPRAWLLASRPKTLSGAIIPVLLGSALAYSDGRIHTLTALLCALFACLMQIAANFVNDWYDFSKGSDREDRLGPERACAQGWITPSAMKRAVGIVIIVACIEGLAVLFTEQEGMAWHGLELFIVGLLCVVFCILYTTCLSYLGLGDVLVLLFFGIIPVCGTYYVQAHTLSWACFILSLVSGICIDTLLIVNNYRDRDQDRISGKRTIIVRFGEPFGRYAYLLLGVIAVLLSSLLIHYGKISCLGYVLSAGSYLVLHILTWKRMVSINHGKELNSILGQNSRNMLLFGILLSIALVVQGVGC